jgi:iron-sulfur cluster repair protein YtfE (RIC family)
MKLLTQPLRDEHKELMPHIEEIRTVANLVGDVPVPMLRQQVDNVIVFLMHHLIPHAQAEDQALYPVIGKILGTTDALATMKFDHVEIGRMSKQLALLRSNISDTPPNPSQIKYLREILYSLYTLIKIHFVKEEEIFLPMLDAKLTPAESQRMFEALETAAAEAKSHA